MAGGASAERMSLSVSQLTAYVKRLIDRDEVLQQISVRGEISNFTAHRSGHLYFSLKDEGSQLSCVCFRGDACRLGFEPGHGQQVIAHGNITVYEPRGQYQLIVRAMRPDGAGELAAAIAKLRMKLEAEGLFDPSRKRPLPRFPRRIALVTSPTGAAVRDMVSVISRRFPPAEIVVVPTVVQGEAAPDSIIKSINLASNACDADLLIVGRGGGSLEDLWAFYDERVVRAVFACPAPVISAVGHETDVSLTDEVADSRAPTPSAAGELAVPDVRELQATLNRLGERARGALAQRLTLGASRLGAVCTRPMIERPLSVVEPRWQRLDEASVRLMRAADTAAERLRERLSRAEVTLRARDAGLRRRLLALDERGARVREAERRARAGLERRWDRARDRLSAVGGRLTTRLLATTATRRRVDELARRGRSAVLRNLRERHSRTQSLTISPRLADIRGMSLQVNRLCDRACALVDRGRGRRRGHLDRASAALSPSRRLTETREMALQVDGLCARARALVDRGHGRRRGRLDTASASLRALDPNEVVRRGYAIVRRDEDGELIRSIDQTVADDSLTLRVSDGKIAARVVDVFGGEDDR